MHPALWWTLNRLPGAGAGYTHGNFPDRAHVVMEEITHKNGKK